MITVYQDQPCISIGNKGGMIKVMHFLKMDKIINLSKLFQTEDADQSDHQDDKVIKNAQSCSSTEDGKFKVMLLTSNYICLCN